MLNPQQKKAAEAPNGYVQIIAGPGTGKTSTLVARIVELIKRGIDPRRICVLSFTKAAARELKLRVSKELGKQCKIIIGTFHSVSYRFICRFGRSEPPGLIDEKEKFEILKKLFPKELNLKRIAKSINEDQARDVDPIKGSDLEKYLEMTRSINKVDFDGLISVFYELLKKSKGPQRSLDAVLVDEFQDTSILQLKIALLMASECQNLTVVGDPAQSIYSFRNANPRTFAKMKKKCESEHKSEVHCMQLDLNYRSTQPILDAAHELLSAEKGSDVTIHQLKSERYRIGIPVRFCLAETRESEASNLGGMISQLIESGVKPTEICVLSRHSLGYRNLESELTMRQINTRLVGGQKIASSRPVRLMVDYLRVVLDENDSMAISRTLNDPPRKIGPKTAEVVSCGPGNFPQMRLIKLRLHDVRFRSYLKIVDEVRKVLGETQDLKSVTNAIETLGKLIKADSDKVTELKNMAGQFALMIAEDEDPEETRTFAQLFVSVWALGTGDKASDTKSAVTLSTIHSAKGLEWPIVFLINSNYEDRIARYESPDKLESHNTVIMGEERRLLYVALTRAKHYLVVSAFGTSFDKTFECFSAKKDEKLNLEADLKVLSQLLGRKLTYVPGKFIRKTAPTNLGKGIELPEGFVLASDLPPSAPPKTFQISTQLITKPRKLSKQAQQILNNRTITSFFRPSS